MRRLVILLLLFLGMQLVLPLGTRAQNPQSLLTFGFLILAAYTVGEVAVAARLPKIVGYLVAGVLFGPHGLRTISEPVMDTLSPISALAIALIAFLAGAELRWSEIRSRGVPILKMLGSEMTLVLFAVLGTLYALQRFIPFMRDAPAVEAFAFALLYAAMTAVHSPAVTMALLTETGARGPVARTTLGIVLVSDVVIVLLFTGVIALARSLTPPAAATGGLSVGLLAWEILGALLVGALVGLGVALYLRFVQRELFIFGIVVAFIGAEIARLAHVEVLLSLLVAGFVTENVSRNNEGEALRHAMERSAAPVFVVFFALAGAQIALPEVAAFWPLLIPIVGVRTLALWGGTTLGARWAREEPVVRQYAWFGLISQAGVAIGLATVVANVYPERGAQIRTLFLAALAVNQTLGPILFKHALTRSGEVTEGDGPDEPRNAAAH